MRLTLLSIGRLGRSFAQPADSPERELTPPLLPSVTIAPAPNGLKICQVLLNLLTELPLQAELQQLTRSDSELRLREDRDDLRRGNRKSHR